MAQHDPHLRVVAIADEDLERLALITRIVMNDGFLPLPAYNQRKLHRVLSTIRPDVAVVHADFLTGANATDLCKLLADEGDHKTQVVLIAEQPQIAPASGDETLVSEHFVLPIEPRQLTGTLRRLLRREAMTLVAEELPAGSAAR